MQTVKSNAAINSCKGQGVTMAKKTIEDMPENWQKKHCITGLPDGVLGWCKDAKIALPSLPTEDQIQKAWEDIGDAALLSTMVKEILEGIDIISQDPRSTKEQREAVERMRASVEEACQAMKRASKIAYDKGLLKSDTKSDT